MATRTIKIDDLMTRSGVTFGTSGARGRVEDMTDEVCYAYTVAFLQHLEQNRDLSSGSAVAIGGDLRPSTPRIMAAVGMAAAGRGYRVINCGFLPSPAVALYGIEQGVPAIMVTGSHIPDDRNGIKFNTPAGEILKADEAAIKAQAVAIPDGLFDAQGNATLQHALPDVDQAAVEAYVKRYLDFFPRGCLQGMTVGLYEHSSVAREPMGAILNGLGAEVVHLGRSDTFIPVDTEAVRPEDIALAKRWAAEQQLDSIVSADGDGDRPLISDEQGNWLRGDIAGILCARYLGAEAVVTPVSSNTAAEKSGLFRDVIRTRIGSPYVIEGMEAAKAAGARRVVGYEANGGFLTATPIESDSAILPALPTRDAVIVALAILRMVKEAGGVAQLLSTLPPRYTASDRVKEFPTDRSRDKLNELAPTPDGDLSPFQTAFGALCGKPLSADRTDGLRVTFENGEIIHLRPSGNAPEFRCYVEAASQERSAELLQGCMHILQSWK